MTFQTVHNAQLCQCPSNHNWGDDGYPRVPALGFKPRSRGIYLRAVPDEIIAYRVQVAFWGTSEDDPGQSRGLGPTARYLHTDDVPSVLV